MTPGYSLKRRMSGGEVNLPIVPVYTTIFFSFARSLLSALVILVQVLGGGGGGGGVITPLPHLSMALDR